MLGEFNLTEAGPTCEACEYTRSTVHGSDEESEDPGPLAMRLVAFWGLAMMATIAVRFLLA